MGANVFRHLIQNKSLNALYLPPPLDFSKGYIKAKKEDIVRVPDFYQQTVQREGFCIHSVTFLYEASEPVGSQ